MWPITRGRRSSSDGTQDQGEAGAEASRGGVLGATDRGAGHVAAFGGRGVDAADREGVDYDAVADLGDAEVYARFFPGRGEHESVHAQPDWDQVHRELARVGVTLKLLHGEYVDACRADGSPAMGCGQPASGRRRAILCTLLQLRGCSEVLTGGRTGMSGDGRASRRLIPRLLELSKHSKLTDGPWSSPE